MTGMEADKKGQTRIMVRMTRDLTYQSSPVYHVTDWCRCSCLTQDEYET